MLIHENVYQGIAKWNFILKDSLCNDTKWVCIHLFWYGKANFKLLARGNFHHLMFIIALLLVWAVGYMDPDKTDWVSKHAKVLREFELATCRFKCDTSAFWPIGNTLYCVWQRYKRGREGHFEITLTSQCYFHSIWIGTYKRFF